MQYFVHEGIHVYHSLLCILAVSYVFQVMEAYAGGLKAMKAAQQAHPLSREELEDVMDQLQDVSVYAFVHVVTGYVWMILGQSFRFGSIKKRSLLKRVRHLWMF